MQPDTFKRFLNGLQTASNANLIESIEKGYMAIYEDEAEDIEEIIQKTVSFEFKNTEGSVKRILDLYKSGNKGIMILDPEGDMDEPVTSFIRSGDYKYDITDIEDEDSRCKQKCEITVSAKAHSKKYLKLKADNIKDLFEKIGGLGNCGHSYTIKFVPVNNQAKIQDIGWDGDGSDYIDLKSFKVS